MMELCGRKFDKYISCTEIYNIIKNLSERINQDYANSEEIVFIVILNGAFMFATDLFKQIKGLHRISFVKFSSYDGIESTHKVSQIIGLNENINNKNIIIVEDIIDSGDTMYHILQILNKQHPKSLEICTLMFKPENFKYNYNIKYIGKSIGKEFIIGYGFDINGLGRNLPDIYRNIE